MKIFVTGIAIMILFFACEDQKSDVMLFDRLQGIWKIENEIQFEKWIKNQNGSFNSVMFSVNGSDTVYSENVKIYKNGVNWVFETLVKNQNDNKTVKFESDQLSNTEVTFKNPAHDFPKIIHYKLESPTVLRAYIAGNSDTVFFNFRKVK